MVEWAQQFMERMGYVGVSLLMILENVFPPIPSEAVMPFAGFVAARGELSLPGVCIAGTVGSVIGALPLYYIGRFVGTHRVKRWADRWGKWLALDSGDVQRAMDWFDRRGRWAVLVGRLVPGVRSLISIPAGACAMPLAPFLIFTAIGSAAWTTALAYAGHQLGEHWDRAQGWVKPVGWVVTILVLGWIVIGVWRRRRRKQSDPSSTARADGSR